ncbi:CfrBI family restriction endonuclease [Alteribacillus sp. YIM 98480]|uniref:CfrBI family restriction endonuclease n=1 Tax=Alteribacillus sp. YIM 98480 TaxID=2606599 RepID=UPI00131AD405|nr:CfrBI family restriction endonuclease [Alteribacillus sp. YIM 98480]
MEQKEKTEIHDNYPDYGKKLMKASGDKMIDQVGNEGMQELLYNVLTGGNVRDITEFLSKQRLMKSNAALMELIFTTFSYEIKGEDYFKEISEGLKNTAKKNASLYLWLLGLTNKALDNVVRGPENIENYKEQLIETFNEQTEEIEQEFGEISGTLRYKGKEIEINWNVLNKLFMAIGSQTLTIRGSEKSSYGKLFGSLVLSTVLQMFGFELIDGPPKEGEKNSKVFWLEFEAADKREADAVLLYENKGIMFDIGFIGKGNPEITYDKVTRFDKQQEYADQDFEMKTIIVVDTTPKKGKGEGLARDIGSIIQMNHPHWVQQLAATIQQFTNYEDPILNVPIEYLGNYIDKNLMEIDFMKEINKFRK